MKHKITHKRYNIIMKIGGAACIICGIAIMIDGYANPISAGIVYIMIGILFMLMRLNPKEGV